MSPSSAVITVADLVSAEGSIVESGEIVVRRVLEELERHESVTVSLRGVRGIPSSFFNVILQDVIARYGTNVLSTRLGFEFDSRAQETLLSRCLSAIGSSPR